MKRYALLIFVILLMSYYSPIQTNTEILSDSETISSARNISGNQTQSGSFNTSLPGIDDLYTVPLILQFDTCFISSGNNITPSYQDYAQAEDGTYYILGTSQATGILLDGTQVRLMDALLMHFDEEGDCLDVRAYPQIVTDTTFTSSQVRPQENGRWHSNGAHTLIVLDTNSIIITGTLGYEAYDHSSWGGMINSSTISPNSQQGEHFFIAKISRSNLSIIDWKILPAWTEGQTANGPCQRIGTYPQTFSNSTEFAVAIGFSCVPHATNTRGNMEILGTTYEVNYCTSGSYDTCRSKNILLRFSHNLSVIESVEIPTPYTFDGNINFLESGVAVTLTGTDAISPKLEAYYRIPGQQWINVNYDSGDFPSRHTSILTLDGERFGWVYVTENPSLPQQVILNVVNTTSGNTTQYDLGNISFTGNHVLQGGGFALNQHRILQHFQLGGDTFTTPDGRSMTGDFVIHYDLDSQNLSFISNNLDTEFKSKDSTTAHIRQYSDQSVRSVDVFVGESIIWQTTTGGIYIREIDQDNDGVPDRSDAFPFDDTQQSDTDSDGFGDNPIGTSPDECPYLAGNSTIDLLGCPDNDGDGFSNQGDLFQNDASQSADFDSDGYGDNLTGTFGDICPYTYGESTRDRYGCPDADFDGWSDENDIFPYDSSQWGDWDGDGFGDQLNGIEGDSCPSDPGNSTKDRYGCIDSDGDGWSDDGDDLPQNPTQWRDRDGDGYGDNQEENSTMSDAFPADGTQWNDTDEDGYGDNPFGTQGDWFPNDPTRWQDSDQDGVADEDDAFPNEKSQTIDIDGDGYGDDANGSNPDAFPNDAQEWSDTDGDGIGNNADAFPFDPSQQIDSDGDGFGDNERGSGADKFPSDSTQWSDIDGDGYGDNAEGTNPDAFIADPTQWSDSDGDGYGDNPTGRLADAFTEDSTQWLDEDGDGLGDNQSGTNADPYLNDFDNDGYNDSIDPLPKLPSPGDLDNDGVLDVNDLFPEDFREWADYDGDGEGDNADTDDDNDGWADTDEIRVGTDPFNSAEEPVDSFEIVIPGTAVGLGAWDLIGMFGGIPLALWIGFGFATRNGRTAKYEALLREAQTRDELEDVARMWEYSLMLRMLGPHQGIRLERLRAELDDRFEAQNQSLSSIEPKQHDQTQMVEQAMQAEQKSLPSLESTQPEITAQGNPDGKGYEWYTDGQETSWYRNEGSNSEWQRFEA